jgi:hypothetical protein
LKLQVRNFCSAGTIAELMSDGVTWIFQCKHAQVADIISDIRSISNMVDKFAKTFPVHVISIEKIISKFSKIDPVVPI